MFAALLLSACGIDYSKDYSNTATIKIESPYSFSKPINSRALDSDGTEIPAEITQILFNLSTLDGDLIKEIDLLNEAGSVEFRVTTGQTYTLSGTALAADEQLYFGSQVIAELKAGETRSVSISLDAQLQISLDLGTDGNSEKPLDIKIAVGDEQST